MILHYYDIDGNPIEMLEWAELFEDDSYKRVALDEIGDVQVSTVWLGLDHNWADGPPIIFETMVFGGDMDQCMQRYSTKEAALQGHQLLVDHIRGGNG